jgi:hypothetical protein
MGMSVLLNNISSSQKGAQKMSPRPVTMLAAACLLAAAPTLAFAQVNTSAPSGTSVPLTSTGTAHLIEWDLASLPDALDGNPGAMVVDTRGEDNNRAWFVTRVAAPDADAGGQRVYRFDPARSLMKGNANWTSWDLRIDTFAGGLKKMRPSHDRRYVFVRTASFIQRIDTQNCTAGTAPTCNRTVWTFSETPTDPTFVSDIAVDDQNHVFTTGVSSVFPTGYVQMLTPGLTTVKRWTLDLGTPTACPSQGDPNANGGTGGSSLSCLSGIDVHPQPSKQNLVYFTEQGTNTIAELNISVTNPSTTRPNIRRWSLDKLSAATHETITQPRTLRIDKWGKIWVNTGSGHLVSLDPSTSKMTKHLIPAGSANDPWGLAPDDDVVGYTGADTSKVAMLFPKFPAVYIAPDPGFAPYAPFDTVATNEPSSVVSGSVQGTPKVVNATTTRKDDGTYVEAFINTNNDSLSPLGITPNHGKAQGTFFYTVGLAAGTTTDPTTGAVVFDPTSPSIAKRIGFVRLPIKEKIKNGRDDDDADDGEDRNFKPGWHNSEPGDDDADGVPDQYDTSTNRESSTAFDPALLPGQQSVDYPVSTSASTLALIASVEADPLSMIAVDIYNGLGVLSATSGPLTGTALVTLPLPGAGTYTARVRNLGTGAVTQAPTIILREPGLPQQ